MPAAIKAGESSEKWETCLFIVHSIYNHKKEKISLKNNWNVELQLQKGR